MPHPRIPSKNESGQKKVNHGQLNPVHDTIYSNVSCLEDEIPDWEFPREQVHIQKYVGKGAFCVVAQAFVEGLGTVAIKIPKGALKTHCRKLGQLEFCGKKHETNWNWTQNN